MKTKKNKKIKNVRLPSHVVPVHYDVTLKPDLEAHTFSGEVVVNLELKKTVKEITLHSKDLDLTTAHAGILFPAKVAYNTKAETATLSFKKPLAKGAQTLTITFKGVLKNNLRGFYKSTFTHEGKEHTIATTQFEATDARRALPCFDEPAQKATFGVTLIVPGDKTVISNTLPVETREHENGWKLVRFLPTPKMSTYLLAFIVGDFEHIEGKTKRGVPVRVVTTPGKTHQASFALDCAIRTLDFYEKYFDIKYPLPVLDMIAIPDFASGAMENWGAITYRETALLVDAEFSSIRTKQWVALVVAHELAHQWFGNLVTMEWWTHLWLNEGFASFIEYLAVNELFPSWDIWTQFTALDLGAALRLDALVTTHPIEIEVNHPSEISEIFDDVSYSKGASIIRMLEDYLGAKDFRDGLRYYLKKHSYKNASTIHLWEAFEKVSGKPVKKLMDNFTKMPGYPIVRMSENAKGVTMEQERFFSNPKSKERAKDKTVWSVPLSVLAGSENKVKRVLLDSSRGEMKTPPVSWYKGNAREVGMYRVAYDKAILASLIEPVSSKKLSAPDRLGIIRDLFATAEAGTIGSVAPLEFLSSYKNETDYTVWVEIVSGLMRLRNVVTEPSARKSYDAFVIRNMQEVKRHVGLKAKKGEAHTKALLRTLIWGTLGVLGDKEVLAWAKREWKSPAKIPADMRGIVYGTIASHGGKKEFTKLVALYKNATMHEEKNRIGAALGEFEDEKLLSGALIFALSKEVRVQDAPGIIAGVFGNSHGRALGWRFLKTHWDEMLTRYGEGGMMLSRLIRPAGLFVDMKNADDIRAFFKTHPAPGAERTITQILERIETNHLWKSRDEGNVAKWLEMK